MFLTQYKIRWLVGAALCSVVLHSAGSEQNHHEEKHKLDPAIATRASLISIGFQALNQPPAQVNHAQAAIKNVAT